MKKAIKWTARIVFPLLSILMIIFIFWQSSMDADASAAESGFLMDLINRFFQSWGIDTAVTEYLIRKTAHFTEFFMLGTFLFGTMKVWLDKDILLLIYPAAAGLLVAVSDEFIQMFSFGRSAELNDAMLDLAGALTAVVLLYLLLLLIRDIRKSRSDPEDGSVNEAENEEDIEEEDEAEAKTENGPEEEPSDEAIEITEEPAEKAAEISESEQADEAAEITVNITETEKERETEIE